MSFASINLTNPRTNPWNFPKNILRIGGFWVGHFEKCFSKKKPTWKPVSFLSSKDDNIESKEIASKQRKKWNFSLISNMKKIGMKLLNWDSQQGRDRATSGSNNKKFNWANIILILWGKSGIVKFEFKPNVSTCIYGNFNWRATNATKNIFQFWPWSIETFFRFILWQTPFNMIWRGLVLS